MSHDPFVVIADKGGDWSQKYVAGQTPTLISIVIEIDHKDWRWELTGEGEAPEDRWKTQPEDVLAEAISYMTDWRMGDGYSYSGTIQEGDR